MGLDWGLLTKAPQFDMFARPITVNGVAARGIWHKDANEFFAEDGSIVIDNKTSIDILNSEFAVTPRQGDMVEVPADGAVPAEASHTVLSSHDDGGGMTNLVLEQYITTVAMPSAEQTQRATANTHRFRPAGRAWE
ncbi:MAG: hypothetical protein WCB99_03810 [Candidatus Cybelea sp.]